MQIFGFSYSLNLHITKVDSQCQGHTSGCLEGQEDGRASNPLKLTFKRKLENSQNCLERQIRLSSQRLEGTPHWVQ